MKEENRTEIEAFRQKYKINQFVCLYSERGINQLAEIISCRVQLAQYELLREGGKNIAWEEYVYQLAASEDMQAKARRQPSRQNGTFRHLLLMNWKNKKEKTVQQFLP